MSIESQKLLRVKSEILNEIKDLQKTEEELQKWKELHGKSPDSFDLRAAGSLLQDFYTSIEQIFERIGRELNGGIPTGEDWHREILDNMSLAIEKVRPAVISKELRQMLTEYLKFRYLFRNIYGFRLERKKMKPLLENLPGTSKRFQQEISIFCDFLDQTAGKIK